MESTKVKTPKDLTNFLCENENHPNYERLTDEWASIEVLRSQLHKHTSDSLIAKALHHGGGEDIDAFGEWLMKKDHKSAFSILIGDHSRELKKTIADKFVTFMDERYENFHVRDGYWLCLDDEKIWRDIDEKLELCNQLISESE